MGLFSNSRAGRDNKGDDSNSRSAWWNSGRPISNDDHVNHPLNLGLGSRERRALSEENSRPWGQSLFASSIISERTKEAKRQAEAKEAKRQAEAKKAKAAKDAKAKSRAAARKKNSLWLAARPLTLPPMLALALCTLASMS